MNLFVTVLLMCPFLFFFLYYEKHQGHFCDSFVFLRSIYFFELELELELELEFASKIILRCVSQESRTQQYRHYGRVSYQNSRRGAKNYKMSTPTSSSSSSSPSPSLSSSANREGQNHSSTNTNTPNTSSSNHNINSSRGYTTRPSRGYSDGRSQRGDCLDVFDLCTYKFVC